MFRRRTPSAPVHYFRPTLEALEERNLLDAAPPLPPPALSPLGALLHNYATNVLDNNANTLLGLGLDAGRQIAALRQNPANLAPLASLATDNAVLQQTADQLASQTTAFFTFVQAGFVFGLLQPQDINVLVNDVVSLAQSSSFDQKTVNATTDALFEALSGAPISADAISSFTVASPVGAIA